MSGAVWLVSAALGNWVGTTAGIVALLLGGMLIFPLTTLALKATGGPAALPTGHPMAALATQLAFTVPIGLLVALGAALYRLDWFYPGALLIVGAHYLPFVFLYGMRLFAVLAAAMVAAGMVLALWVDAGSSAGGWLGGAMLVAAAVALRASVRQESVGAS